MTTRSLCFGALLLTGLVFFSGCAITTKVPVNRFDSPEAMGKEGELLAGFEGNSEYTITADDTATPPNFSNPTFDKSADFILNGGVSLAALIPRTDIYAKFRTAGVLEGIVKFQILGQPRSVARKGNFSLAVTAGAGASSSSGSDTDASFLSTTTTTGQFSTNSSAVDLGAIIGYRLADWVLVYGGWGWTRQTYSGTLTQTSSGGGGSSQFLYSGQLRQNTADLGFEFNPGAFLGRIEYALAWTSAPATSLAYHNGYLGIEVGINFGGFSRAVGNGGAEADKVPVSQGVPANK